MDAHDDVTRIGNAERDDALTALGEHMRAGRLDPHEYGERAEAVGTARTPAALAPLFADLPAPGPFLTGSATSRPAGAVPLVEAGVGGRTGDGGRIEPWGGRAGAALVAASPFVAMIIAVTTSFWWAFFLVPLAGAVVWGDPKGYRYGRRGGARGYRRGW